MLCYRVGFDRLSGQGGSERGCLEPAMATIEHLPPPARIKTRPYPSVARVAGKPYSRIRKKLVDGCLRVPLFSLLYKFPLNLFFLADKIQ